MKVSVPTPDLDARQKRTLLLSVLGLGALAATGEGYRRRRQSGSSELAKKGLVVILVLMAISALAAMGARHRRAKEAPDVSVTEDGSGSDVEDRVESIVAPTPAEATATSADGRER